MVSPIDRGTVLICAVRYALGRQTYVVAEICGIVRKCLFELRDADREILARDVANWLKRTPPSAAGDADVENWRELHTWMTTTPASCGASA